VYCFEIEVQTEDSMHWLQLGIHEYEYGGNGQETGWYRAVGGRMSNGRWPAWHNKTGATKYT
jgi:hypothetical protein